MVENQPLSAFAESLQRGLWQTHPYARPVTGTEEEILSLTREDVMDIYRRYYVPNNAIIVISGDIEPQTAYRLAEKYYGKVPAGHEIGKKFSRSQSDNPHYVENEAAAGGAAAGCPPLCR